MGYRWLLRAVQYEELKTSRCMNVLEARSARPPLSRSQNCVRTTGFLSSRYSIHDIQFPSYTAGRYETYSAVFPLHPVFVAQQTSIQNMCEFIHACICTTQRYPWLDTLFLLSVYRSRATIKDILYLVLLVIGYESLQLQLVDEVPRLLSY
jgi:hypothetical protein